MKKYIFPAVMLAIFEAVAVTLWLTKDNLFYLFNFSYIALSLFLFVQNHPHARRVAQLMVGLYMLVYLGLICNENMQIEGFWYYLFTGVFEAATIHYAVAKIFGPLVFGRGWCGYACWTAMVLDFLPYKIPQQPRKKIGWIRYAVFAACGKHGKNHVLGLCDWQSAVLRGGYHSGLPFSGQQGVLQIHMSDHRVPQANELFFAAPRDL